MKSPYTLVPDRAAQTYVEEVLETIIREILCRVGANNCLAILLIGSFGRGEGGVRKRGDGWKIVNDIELWVIQDKPTPWLLNGLEEEIEKRFGIYDIDIHVKTTGQLKPIAPTMFAYDVRYGSQIIYGDQEFIKAMGELNSSDIPVWEGARLLLNRSGGLIMHFTWPRYLARLQLPDEIQQYMKNQLVKTGLALGDALIVCHQIYHTSYKKRWSIFQSLIAEGQIKLSTDDAAFIAQCYEEKLFPGTHRIFNDLFTCYEKLLMQIFMPVFLHVMSEYFSAALPDINTYFHTMAKDIMQKASIRNTFLWPILRSAKLALRARRLPRKDDWLDRRPVPKEAIYAAIPLVLYAAPFLSSPRLEQLKTAEVLLNVSKPLTLTCSEDRWENLRAICFKLWYATCH